ncbi:MAG TPA: SprT family zinc-dependent metalloprotease [Sphingomicrobium sp.]|nr:SprT family zinc-dependent metalloprotease [Sphingomicrobium sp.]
MTELRTVHYGANEISFALERSGRRTLGITVRADGSVVVRAPETADLPKIEDRVRKRAGWIMSQQARAERYRPRTPPRTYEEGETHLHLGHQYRLSVELALAQGVRIEGDRIILSMHRPRRREDRAELLRAWRYAQARMLYPKRLATLFGPFRSYCSAQPRLIIRDLTHRWGSLTDRGNMVLSRDLIQAPRSCIDYVITHELCHLVHADHGQGFRTLLSQLMPDHIHRKERLEQIML